MRITQRFEKNINSLSDTDSDLDARLTICLFDIDKNTALEDVLNEVKKIHSTHFSR